jgi:hypothetical protein
MNRHAESLLAALSPPVPPSRLRRRTLAAARAAATGAGRAPDVWNRLWASRPVRLAWAVAVVALAIGHLAVSGRAPRSPAENAVPVAMIAMERGELAEVADVGRLTAELPGWEVAAAGRGESLGRKEPS